MDTDQFTLRPLSASRLLEVELRGRWSEQTVADYQAARHRALRELQAAGVPLARLRIFVDARALAVQSQAAFAAFDRLVVKSQFHPQRSALVVTSKLAALQLARLGMPGQRVFADTDFDAAKAWLMADSTA